MNRIIIVNKEKDMTSRDVVNIVSKKLGTKKVGHTGTLDPLATGVLVLLTGRYTKLNEYFMATKKEYIAEVAMGYLTDTLDRTGTILEQEKTSPTKEELEQVFRTFPRTYMQEVPLYSAIKVGGKKLYQYARNQEAVTLPKKEVHLYELELLKVNDKSFTFRAVVSKGTYIRSLIRDLGISCGHLFTMSELKRTKQGVFSIEDAFLLDDITKDYQGPKLQEVLDIPVEIVDSNTAFKIKNGCSLENPKKYQAVLFLTPSMEELAIYKNENGILKVDKMIGSEDE